MLVDVVPPTDVEVSFVRGKRASPLVDLPNSSREPGAMASTSISAPFPLVSPPGPRLGIGTMTSRTVRAAGMTVVMNVCREIGGV